MTSVVRCERVALATQAAGRGVDHDAWGSHEVRVAGDPRLGVEPGNGLLEESTNLGVGAAGAKLGEPDWLAERLPGLREVPLQVGKICGAVVPVQRNGVDGAAGAIAQEALQPGEAHGCGAVCDGRAHEHGLTRKGLHILHVGLGGHRGRQVALCVEVGLVEREQGGRAGRDGGGGVARPRGGEARRIGPEHRDELEARTLAGQVCRAGRLGPVVDPRRRG